MDYDTFLISVDKTPNGEYVAMYSSGLSIPLDASNYHDAILEADLIEPQEFQ
jgi:hypothetical protein